ncbi:alpha-L-rhamnosidase C-terminal domain-containing protein [Streptomyces mexicanus]|uniref:alpha-L-rhamnosidase C-terminal domain-containing protein n=1 Tax=Streptomyces mexicanus TaxID=178566 RepID=UPI0031ED9498
MRSLDARREIPHGEEPDGDRTASSHAVTDLELQGVPKGATVLVRGMVLHTDNASAGDLTTSDALINGTHSLIRRAVEGNTMSVLTDCPSREKLGRCPRPRPDRGLGGIRRTPRRPGGQGRHDIGVRLLPHPYGLARTAWLRDGDRFHLSVDVPAGSTAEVRLPLVRPARAGAGGSAAAAHRGRGRPSGVPREFRALGVPDGDAAGLTANGSG